MEQEIRSSAGLLATKIPSALAFLVVIGLFFLPFAEVRCNGKRLVSNTGIGIAIGDEWKQEVTKTFLGIDVENKSHEYDRDRKGKPNVFAIVALALAVVGVLIATLTVKASINIVVGLLGAASLIGMLIDLRSKANSEDSDSSANGMVSVDGTPAFYCAIALFLLAALLSWQRSRALMRPT